MPAILSHPLLPEVLLIPNTGPQAIVPGGKEVVVGVACGVAVLRGAQVFVPGVLGAPKCNHGNQLMHDLISMLALAVGDRVAVVVDRDKKCLRGSTERFMGPTVFVGQ